MIGQGKPHYNYGLPLNFIYDGLMYSKQISGFYKCHPVEEPENVINNSITIEDIVRIIKEFTYIETILYLSSNEKHKLR